jgi:hypothetical protein
MLNCLVIKDFCILRKADKGRHFTPTAATMAKTARPVKKLTKAAITGRTQNPGATFSGNNVAMPDFHPVRNG